MFSELFPIEWSVFHFLRMEFLWLMVPVLVLLILGLLSLRQEIRWQEIIAPHLRPYVIQDGSVRKKFWMHIVLMLALSLGVFSLAGPTWKKIQLPGQILETPVVVILDLSQSMMAEDLQPSRLERAKFKIRDLLKYNPQARVALIGFSGTAHTIVPLTKDYEIINSHLDGLSPSTMPFPGSDLEMALALGDSVMSITDAPGHVLIFSDDFDEGDFDLLNVYAANSGNSIEIVPMNTSSGSEIPNPGGRGHMQEGGQAIHSALNEQILSGLASVENVSVHRLTLDDSDVEKIAGAISRNLLFTEEPEDTEDDWRDVGLLLVIPMAFLLLFWFRKGWVIFVLPLFLFSSCSDAGRFADLWFTHDYQGQRLSGQGDFAKAAERYEDPLRKGVAYYKAGDYEEAIEFFDRDTSANGIYNLGLAYFMNGDTLAAMFAFNQAVEMDPENEDARTGRDQLSKMLPQTDELDPEDAQEAGEGGAAQNTENQGPEDLSGGGQEATEEDMQKERQEETVSTDIHKGKELDEVPDDISASIQQPDNSKIVMQKVDDDPTLFLKRKFEFQVKEKNLKPRPDGKKY